MLLNKWNIIYNYYFVINYAKITNNACVQNKIIKGIKIKIISSLINNLKHLVIPFDPSAS